MNDFSPRRYFLLAGITLTVTVVLGIIVMEVVLRLSATVRQPATARHRWCWERLACPGIRFLMDVASVEDIEGVPRRSALCDKTEVVY